MFGLTTTRRHNAEIAALRSQYDALRERGETAEKNEASELAAKRTAARQFTEADAANQRLANRNLELGRQISALTEADPGHLTAMQERLALRGRAARRILAAYAVLERHADGLQKQLDDAFSLDAPAVAAGATWQDRREQKMRYDK